MPNHIEKQVVPFSFQSHEVNTVTHKDGAVWFSAKDVCDILGLGHVSHSLIELDEDEKTECSLTTAGSNISKLRIINESGLYHLIFKSRKPEAKTFRKWVTSEVLPSIRKTGRYSLPDQNRGFSGWDSEESIDLLRHSSALGKNMFARTAIAILKEMDVNLVHLVYEAQPDLFMPLQVRPELVMPVNSAAVHEDSVHNFIKDRCLTGEKKRCLPPVWYEHYKKWCSDNGLYPLGKIRAYKILALNYSVRRTRPTNSSTEFFEGITFNPAAYSQPEGE